MHGKNNLQMHKVGMFLTLSRLIWIISVLVSPAVPEKTGKAKFVV